MEITNFGAFFRNLLGSVASSEEWTGSEIVSTKRSDCGYLGKSGASGNSAVGIAHGSTFFKGGSPVATDQACVWEKSSGGRKALHVAIADGFGHPPQENELRLVCQEAKEVLSYATLHTVKSLQAYREATQKRINGLLRVAGQPHSCRFSYGACLIESFAWREHNKVTVRFGGLGDSIGIVVGADGTVRCVTARPTTQEGAPIAVAFNSAAAQSGDEKHCLFQELVLESVQPVTVITASDALRDAFSNQGVFDVASFENVMRACPDRSPQGIATYLYEEVEKKVSQSVAASKEGECIPFAGDDTTIIVTQV